MKLSEALYHAIGFTRETERSAEDAPFAEEVISTLAPLVSAVYRYEKQKEADEQ